MISTCSESVCSTFDIYDNNNNYYYRPLTHRLNGRGNEHEMVASTLYIERFVTMPT